MTSGIQKPTAYYQFETLYNKSVNELLLQCPFCGGKAKIMYCVSGTKFTSNIFYPIHSALIYCSCCGVSQRHFRNSAIEAIMDWNIRHK